MPIGAHPVDGAYRQGRGVQAGLRVALCHYRKDDAVVETREFAVANDTCTVFEEQTEQQIVLSRRDEAGRQNAEQREHADSFGHRHPAGVPL